MAPNTRPLTILLWAAIVLPIIVAGLFAVFSYNDRLDREKKALADEAGILREHALRVLEAQLSTIDYVDARIDGMSWEQIRQSASLHAMLQKLATASPHIDGIWLIPPDGRTANTADFFPVPPGTDASERDYFRVLKQRDITYLGEMIRGYLKGNLKFSLSRRRSSEDGSFNGAIVITGNVDYFNDFWRRAVKEGKIVGILRQDGEILARHPMLAKLPPKIDPDSPFFDVVRDADRGVFENVARTEGVFRIYAVERLNEFPAFIFAGADRDLFMAPWRRQSVILAVVATGLSAILALLVLTARRYQESLERETGLRQGAEHKLLATEEHIAALEAAESRLRSSEERFRALFETTTQGVLHLDRRGRAIAANPMAQQILGIGEGYIVSHRVRELDLEVIDKDEKPLPPAQRPAAVALHKGELVKDFMMGLRTGEGQIRWLTVDAVPQWRTRESAPWSVFLLITDITEERRAAATEKVLAAEVDHRAKNVLALVQSLVRLSKANSPERLIQTLEGRIAALASAHNLLSRSRWSAVSFTELLNEIISPYRNGNGSRFRINGPRVTLRASATQSMTLMLHELATNAAKYGALSVPEGHIKIAWEIDQEVRVLRLHWKESGGPKVQVPEKTSFGSRMIMLAIEGDLGGRVEKDWNPEGLRMKAEIPLDHVSAILSSDESESKPDTITDETPTDTCQGLRVLVVEDNPIIAADLCDKLETMGCVVEDVVHTIEQAQLAAERGKYDAAILDVDIRGQVIFPVAERLNRRGIPFSFCTGFSMLSEINARWPHAIVLQKPIATADLTRAVESLVHNTA